MTGKTDYDAELKRVKLQKWILLITLLFLVPVFISDKGTALVVVIIGMGTLWLQSLRLSLKLEEAYSELKKHSNPA